MLWADYPRGDFDIPKHGQLARDAIIAATATVHNLIVATRNVRDFAPLGTKTFNPFRA